MIYSWYFVFAWITKNKSFGNGGFSSGCKLVSKLGKRFPLELRTNFILYERGRGFIKGRAPGKLTGCERNLAINLPGCFRLFFLLSFIRKTKNARLKTPTDLLHKNLMKPLERWHRINQKIPRWILLLYGDHSQQTSVSD